jgi:hypothetical protein
MKTIIEKGGSGESFAGIETRFSMAKIEALHVGPWPIS